MTTSTEVRISTKPKKVYKSVAREIFNLTHDSPQPRFDIVLSGGSTPKKLYEKLGKEYNELIPWQRVHFWWGDERCVSPDDENSNFKMAKDALFSCISIPEENIHRIKGENNLEKEADRYTEEIKKNLNYRGENPVFDLVLLGLGEDGHTASIFPDQLELFGEKRICAVTKHPLTGQKRVTLTGTVLNNANRVFFVVTGLSKSMRVSEIMNNDEAAKLLPAYYIELKNGSLIWFLDEAAASRIK